MLRGLALAGGLVVAAATFPAMAQQDHDHNHGSTGAAGQGGMMGPGGMMGQGTGDTTGQGAASPMGGMMGQGGMMDHMRSMMGDDKGGMMGGCSMMGGMGRGGMRGMMMESTPMMEGRLAYMKADLGITDAQGPAWEAYATAVRAQHDAMDKMHGDMMNAMGGSALDRMDARIKAMETMVDSLKALKPATTALYAVLTDAQKEKANKLLGGACGMM